MKKWHEDSINALKSEKGKAAIKKYVDSMIATRERLENRLKRFHEKYKDNLDGVVEHLLKKYTSEQYINKEYRLGYEPREPLLWFLFEYAQQYCDPCEDEAYFNTFTGNACYIGSYVIQVMHGQGSVLRVDKINGIKKFKEYYIIEEYYGTQTTKRSGVPLINHINEGLIILDLIGASMLAKKAYCLHPIFQSDKALVKNDRNHEITSMILTRVMEYRSIANEYLSHRLITDPAEIRLSPFKDVNDMLIADKVQNRKDFEQYHKGKHERSAELDQYFKNWLERLEISEEKYKMFKQKLV